jgi:short-subunit dehydrogenase
MTQQAKTVLITGAYGGLGMALAKIYLETGHKVVLLGRDIDKLNDMCDGLEKFAYDNSVRCCVCDLNDNDSLLSTIQEIKNKSSIDILINCAGVFPINSLEDTTIDEYDKCMQVNLRAPFILMQEFSKDMVKNKWGRIINIASSSAYGGSPNTSVYCASKHALLGLSRSLYKELKGDGVRVFCVSPGSIQTEMGRDVEKLGQIYDTFMTPEEVADYILFATSYDGEMISEEIRLNRVFVQ